MLEQLPEIEEFLLKKCSTVNISDMAKIKVTQIKSAINRPQRQKLTLQALGLGKLNRTVEHEATPQILGMVKKVEHMVKIVK